MPAAVRMVKYPASRPRTARSMVAVLPEYSKPSVECVTVTVLPEAETVSVPFWNDRCACASVYAPFTVMFMFEADSVESSTRTNCTPVSAGAEDVGTISASIMSAIKSAVPFRKRVKRMMVCPPEVDLR
ncbi:hypothetical protein SDC9_64291 [bioreactor metagenome]|uniref:Uncharacterized protein n=1 Tax=bioreactor metagenome TaxID=1076179 RepID=A0A644XQ44_9ZZZZ